MLRKQARDVFIEPFEVGKAAAEYDAVGVENVYDRSERPRHSIFIPKKRSLGFDVALSRQLVDPGRRELLIGDEPMVTRETGTRKKGFDAS